jgi:hypothetical protein
MKVKITLMGIMIGAVLITQTACSKLTEVNDDVTNNGTYESDTKDTLASEDTEDASNQETEQTMDDDKIMDEFDTLIAKENVKLSEVLTYVENNIGSITEENATIMVLNFEELQLKNRTVLEEKYYPEAVQVSFQEAFKNGADFNKIEELSDTSLRDLLEETKSSGYKLDQAEGMYYPVIDYSVYEQLVSTVAPDIKEYYSIMKVESDQAFAKDAALVIEWDEVINRALSAEKFLVTYSDSVKADVMKELYQRYETIALFGLNNTPLFDYESNTMNKEAKTVYEEILNNASTSNFLIKLKGYMEVLKANDYKLTEAVEQYRKELTNQEPSNTEGNTEESRYSVAGIDNASEFEEEFLLLQELITKGNKKAVAEYIAYPITVSIDGIRTDISNENSFVENYDKIISESVKKAIINQKVEETFVNYKGVMVGQGEIWLNKLDGTKKTYSIYGINN